MDPTESSETNKRPAEPSSSFVDPSSKRPRPDESPSKPIEATPPPIPKDDITQNPGVSCELITDPVATLCGREYHDCAKIFTKNGSSYKLKKGDAVFMKNDEEILVCQVNGFFVKISEDTQKVLIEGRWFLSRQDLMGKLGKTITPDVAEFFDHLKDDELVLTHLMEENEISCIQKQCDIYYIRPRETIPESLPPKARICRYQLDIDIQAKTIEWQDLEEEEYDDIQTTLEDQDGGPQTNDDDEEEEEELMNTDSRTMETLSSASDDEESDSSSSSEAPIKAPPIQEGEGSALRGDIQVGQKYQMKVGKFVPGQTVRWRGAKLVHKKGAIDDDKLHEFLEKVAKMHRVYLKQHGILMLEPYTPLSQEKAEDLMKLLPKDELPTGSTLSTASMLSGKRCNLTKECSPDRLLEILADNGYDIQKSLAAVVADLEGITVGWTTHERDIFDDGFRRYEGELRPIAKAIAPTKTMQDVVDFHYRFKIPDQFRKYQDKKREQAARMLTCIETRQYHDALASNSDAGSKPSNWSEKSVTDMAKEKEERVRTAKTLLMDIKARLGKATMVNVASVIRELQVSYTQEAREELFKLLKGQPELQKRFLAFLPKHV